MELLSVTSGQKVQQHSAQNALSSSHIFLVYQSQRNCKSSILSHLLLSPSVQQLGPGLTLDDRLCVLSSIH
jgi:hypothetical protein